MDGPPLVLAHRGACRRAPENTLDAIVAARQLGAQGVELDVRRTADDVLVLCHDPARPEVGLLRDVTFDALREAAPSVPTLREAYGAAADLLVNVEIKCLPWEPDHDPNHDTGDAVVALAAELGVRGSTIVSSFDLEAVNAVRSLDPTLATAWLTFGHDPVESVRVVGDLGHAWLHPDRESLTDPAKLVAAVKAARAADVRLDVWTVDDPTEMRALAEAGVDALITNVPDVAAEAWA